MPFLTCARHLQWTALRTNARRPHELGYACLKTSAYSEFVGCGYDTVFKSTKLVLFFILRAIIGVYGEVQQKMEFNSAAGA